MDDDRYAGEIRAVERRQRGRLAGVRAVVAVGAVAALSGLGAVLAATMIEIPRADTVDAWHREVTDRAEASRVALDLIEPIRRGDQANRARLTELAQTERRYRVVARVLGLSLRAREALAAPPADASRAATVALDPDTGLVDLARDRVVAFRGAALASGATLSEQLPSLREVLGKEPAPTTSTVSVIALSSGTWIVGPALPGDLRALGPLGSMPSTASAAPVEGLAGALVALAGDIDLAAPGAGRIARLRSLIGLAGALLGALLAAWWAWARLSRPTRAATEAALACLHGDAEARADVDRGGPEARDVARTVNLLIERGDPRRSAFGASHGQGVEALASAIETVGKGELSGALPEVPDDLLPLASALDRARAGLRVRVTQVHGIGAEAAIGAASVTRGAREVESAVAEQVETMKRLSADASEAAGDMERAAQSVQTALAALKAFVDAQRRAGQRARASLGVAARRAADLRLAVGRLDTLVAEMAAIDESLDLLGASSRSATPLPEIPEGPGLRSRSEGCARRGRQASEMLKREIAGLREEMNDVAAGLQLVQADAPVPEPDLEGAVPSALHELALGLVGAGERLANALGALERSSKMMLAGLDHVIRGAQSAAHVGPRLDAAVTRIDLGEEADLALVERLVRAREELEDAVRKDRLTPAAESIVDEVSRVAEQAKARLSRLIEATEATAEIIRDTRAGDRG